MDKLWAPWRLKYITQDIKKTKECVFCRMYKEKRKDRRNYVIIRRKHSYVVLNIYPYNNGHLLLVPNRHVADTGDLSKEEQDDFYALLEETKILLKKVMSPEGFNIGMNLGKVAGAGFPRHVHLHIVPRWFGDVNFMPVVGNIKVISQSLEELYKQLTHAYTRRNRNSGK